MAIGHTICASFFLDLLQGVHDFRVDVFKMAFFEDDADLGPDTTAYSATNECSGTAYPAGGFEITVPAGFPKLNDVAQGVAIGRIALVDFDNLDLKGLHITTRGALVYNSSKSNKAVLVRNFGQAITLTGNRMIVAWPQPDVFSAIIKLSGIVE